MIVLRRAATIALLGLGLVGLVACGDDQGSTASTATPSTVSQTFGGLCPAAAAARSGNKARATELFDHGPLHTLAQQLTEVDRSLAARLLEAKEKAEADTTDESVTAATLAVDLDALADVTRQAQVALKQPVLPTCS